MLLPYWVLSIAIEEWFIWVKAFSVISGIILLSLFRTTKLGNTKLCQWAIYLFLVINIFEAVAKDLLTGNIINYLNAAVGILLIATLNKIDSIYIDTKEGYRDLHWGSMTVPWIIVYTLWNLIFIYLNFGLQGSLMHISVLASALLVLFIDRERWLQARVFTLGMYFIILHFFPYLISPINNFMSIIALGVIFCCTLFLMRRSKQFI